MLAFRVKRILDALSAVASVHELNLQMLTSSNRVIVNLQNSDAAVKRAQKQGTTLLFIGFAMIGIGNILTAIAQFFA